MPECRNVRYVYDGSFDGFLCCVYHAVYAREVPAEICTQAQAQMRPCFYPNLYIVTDEARAARVFASLSEKIHPCIVPTVQTVFLSCLENKECALLHYLLFAYRKGRGAAFMLGHPLLAPLLAAERAVRNEAHLLTGFIRFSDCGEALTARIGPKNFVLPLLAPHFCDRYPEENFLIFDETHHAALLYENRRAQLIALDGLTEPPCTAEEAQYRALWRQFYASIGIAARENPRCRQTHMPKRYWAYMTEMQPVPAAAQPAERPLALPPAAPVPPSTVLPSIGG